MWDELACVLRLLSPLHFFAHTPVGGEIKAARQQSASHLLRLFCEDAVFTSRSGETPRLLPWPLLSRGNLHSCDFASGGAMILPQVLQVYFLGKIATVNGNISGSTNLFLRL